MRSRGESENDDDNDAKRPNGGPDDGGKEKDQAYDSQKVFWSDYERYSGCLRG